MQEEGVWVCLELTWRDEERWVIVDGAKVRRSTRGSSEHRIVLSFLICLLPMGLIACEGKQTDTAAGKTEAPSTESRLLRLTPEMFSRMDLQLAQVEQGQLRTSREFPATVQANENALAEVTTLIRGRVVKVHVDVGQDVKKGAVLATLHSVDLGIAEGEYLKATARLYEADLAYKRGKELNQQMVISRAELLRREAAMRTARAEARETENRLALLGVPQEEIKRLNREQTIKANVPLRAPFDGRVIMRNITSGEVVETHQKFFTVADLSDMWVVANVPEKDVQFIRRDQKVDVVIAAYPHAIFTGTITYIGDVLDPATRTMRLRVTVPNPERLLKPEMFAIVRVHAAASAETLSLPVSAVQEGPNGTIVFVQRETGAFEARIVKLGDEQGNLVQVLNGVRVGELVVTKGSFALKSEMERYKIEPAP